jgi:PDZ domain-containing protein
MSAVEPPVAPDEIPPPPPPDLPPAFASPNGSAPRRRIRRWVFLIPILALAYIASLVQLPYFVISPGPASDVLPLIHIQGHQTFAPQGHLLLTAVRLSQPNVYQAIGGWLSPTQAVVPERDILPPGETAEQANVQAFAQMDQSQIDAAVVALTKYAGYPKNHGLGVLVEDVFPGTPAEGKLVVGDLILKVDGSPVDEVSRVGDLIKAAGVGHALAFTFERKLTAAGGSTRTVSRTVSIAPARIQGVSYPLIGVSLVDNFPFAISISDEGIGGPSAGLMWTLGLIDLLTPGDLAHGRTIAGTGTIDLDGKVGEIGGIEEKAVAAERQGASIFFAPASQAAAARSAARRITVVPVRTYTDAVTYLERHP